MRQGDAGKQPAAGADEWTAGRRHIALTLLCFVAFFNLFDRQIMTILLEPIKKEFSASDTEMGLIAGSIFAVFYTMASIPLGRLGDKSSRKLLIGSCLAIWSLLTALGGCVGSFIQLALTRMGVAIGEAGSTPSSYAIIADLYPVRHRAKAMSVFAVASSIGAGTAVMLGGWLAQNFGWRVTLMAVGIPGLLLSLVVLWLLKDPPRGLSDPGSSAVADEPFPLPYVLRYLWQLRSYRWVVLTPALCQVTLFGVLVWGPTFMMRVHGLTPSEVGVAFGGVSTIALVLGQLSGGFVADWGSRRDIRGTMWVAGVAALLGVPFGLLFAFAPGPVLAMAGFGLLCFCMAPITLCATVMAQTLVFPRMRAMSSTILLLIATIIGVGFAPLFVGVSNDFLQARLGEDAIRFSLAIVVCFLLLSSSSALLATRWLRADHDHLR